MSSDRAQGTHDERYESRYQRAGTAGNVGQQLPPSPFPPDVAEHAPRTEDAPANTSIIREVDLGAGVGMNADRPPVNRNPFDPWLWLTSAVLTALGVFFVMAPMLYTETMTTTTNGVYVQPWFLWTSTIAPSLILIGVGTAVVQLFVLSIRYTLRNPNAR